MLVDEIKKAVTAALKAGRSVEKEVLRVALSDIQAEASRAAVDPDDALAQRVLRKLIKSNKETLAARPTEEAQAKLGEEIEVLERFLPKELGEAEIEAALAPVRDQILAAQADGQATGVAMKHLKGSGAVVDGKLVGAVVKKIRA